MKYCCQRSSKLSQGKAKTRKRIENKMTNTSNVSVFTKDNGSSAAVPLARIFISVSSYNTSYYVFMKGGTTAVVVA